jgi:hypothetical protein
LAAIHYGRQRGSLPYNPFLSPCAQSKTTIIVPAFMRFGLRKFTALSACTSLVLFCSCEKHRLGEMPDAQKEHVDLASQPAKSSGASSEGATPFSPSPTLTPAEFFPGSKPR